jgi:hypothetical protein
VDTTFAQQYEVQRRPRKSRNPTANTSVNFRLPLSLMSRLQVDMMKLSKALME